MIDSKRPRIFIATTVEGDYGLLTPATIVLPTIMAFVFFLIEDSHGVLLPIRWVILLASHAIIIVLGSSHKWIEYDCFLLGRSVLGASCKRERLSFFFFISTFLFELEGARTIDWIFKLIGPH